MFAAQKASRPFCATRLLFVKNCGEKNPTERRSRDIAFQQTIVELWINSRQFVAEDLWYRRIQLLHVHSDLNWAVLKLGWIVFTPKRLLTKMFYWMFEMGVRDLRWSASPEWRVLGGHEGGRQQGKVCEAHSR